MKPYPQKSWRHSLDTRFWSSDAYQFSMLTSETMSSPGTYVCSNRSVKAWPISISAATSASLNWAFWKVPIGFPNAFLSFT
jgi:hypothetical protein